MMLGVAIGCSSSTGYGGGGGGTPGPNQVFMQNTAFNPTTRTVSAATVVTWVNHDGVAHTVTYDSGPGNTFDSGNINAGASFTVTFSTAGTIQYHCKIHGSPGAGMQAPSWSSKMALSRAGADRFSTPVPPRA
jgi:plastocyanin